MTEQIKKIYEQFECSGKFVSAQPYGSGHINNTYLVKVDEEAEYILQRLKTVVAPGAKYMHFPDDDDRGYDRRYFRGLLAERLVWVRKRGRMVKEWKNVAKDKRNEPIDLQVYNFACMRSCDPNWDEYERIIQGTAAQAAPEETRATYGCINRGVEV